MKPPEFYDAAVRVDRSGARLEAFKHEMGERFTRRLVRRLSRHVAPAEAVAATAPLPRGNFWLIVSRFDRIDQGSRMLRSVVGFGAGNKAETSVVVYDLPGGRRGIPPPSNDRRLECCTWRDRNRSLFRNRSDGSSRLEISSRERVQA